MDLSADFVKLLRNAKNIVILTGAGISKESGIPTFREAQTGLWTKYDPMDLATPQAFQRNPKLVWDWYAWRRGLILNSNPNPGHYALVKMETRAPNFTLITQNIDGLHEKAGSKHIIELHGNINRNKCSDENVIVEIMDDNEETPPRCPNCGGLIRPDVVWFGENLPPEALADALEASQTCDVFFSIGTSTLVHPAASLPLYALAQGAILIEINPVDTPITLKAEFVFKGASGDVLPNMVNQIWPE